MYKLCFKILISLNLLHYQVNSKDINCLASIDHRIKTFNNSENYADVTCAQCYWFMAGSDVHWRKGSIVNTNMTPIYEPRATMCFYDQDKLDKGNVPWDCHPFNHRKLIVENKENNLYLNQFKDNHQIEIFLKCCSDAINCCESIQSSENVLESKNCPAEWDGWSCWHSAEPSTTELNQCPDMFYIENENMPSECTRDYASKECTSNGTWYTHIINGSLYPREFVNYDKCLRPGANQRMRESYLYIAGYSFSLLLTLIGSMIFLVYKQFKLLRIRIHLNFFLSLMLSCIFSIVYFSQVNLTEPNQITCKIITVLHKSAHLANYCWMLIEGIYLHQLIATMGAIRDKRHAFYYYVFGWGTTPLIMIVYICVHSMQKYDDSCWVHPQTAPDIVWETIPLFCIGLNALLLANVIRVLFMKLRSTPDHLKSGLKASLALVPIYGVQFLFYAIPFTPYESCSAGLFFLKYAEIMVASLQGAMVTAIFCFFNREVRMNIKRSIRRRFPKKDSTEMVTEEVTE